MIVVLVLSCLLIGYSTAIVLISTCLQRDSWAFYTVGNTIVGLLLLGWTLASGTFPAVWGAAATGQTLQQGAAIGAGLALPIIILASLPTPLARSLQGAGVGSISAGLLIFRIVVQATLTTVLFEEFVFRGVVQRIWTNATGNPLLATIGQAAAFSLWHTALLWTMFGGSSRTGRYPGGYIRRSVLTGGGLLAFAILGLVLGLARWRSGTLASPLLAHGTLDILMLVAMAVARRPVAVA